jgi:hypothetical protein
MDNPFQFLLLFVYSVGDHAFTLAGGCLVTVLLGIIQKYVLRREVSWKVDIGVLLAFVLFACFQAWRDQYRAVLISNRETAAVNAKIDQLSKPDFTKFNVKQLWWIYLAKDDATIVSIHLSIINGGADSSVVNYHVHYTSPTLDQAAEQIYPANNPLRLPAPMVGGKQQTFLFYPEDAIQNKTINPIKRGQQVEGRLLVELPGNRTAELGGGRSVFTITIKDYLGNQYVTHFQGMNEANPIPLLHVPGEKSTLAPPGNHQ